MMGCGCNSRRDVAKTNAAICRRCPHHGGSMCLLDGQRYTRTVRPASNPCPLGKHTTDGVVRWMGIHWYGVPAPLRWFGPHFPWGTLAVNISGGLAIGIFAELIAQRFDSSPELRLFIVTGILGGFTTFSAFSLEVTGMAERGDYLTALIYVLASVIISVAAVFAGLALVRAFV